MNTTLTLVQQVNVLAHFFALGAKAWDEFTSGFVTTEEGEFFGHFSPGLEVGRTFVVTRLGTETPEFEVRALTTRSHTLRDLTPEPAAGSIEIDFVFPGQGCVLLREKYDRDAASGGCGIYWLPKGQEEGNAEKLLEITAQTENYTMAIGVGNKEKVVGTFKVTENTADCTDSEGNLIIGVKFTDNQIDYDFKPTKSKIQLIK